MRAIALTVTAVLAFGVTGAAAVILKSQGNIQSRDITDLLSKNRRAAILGIVVISNLITPGADFVSPAVMSVVLYGLFEASIVMIRMGGK